VERTRQNSPLGIALDTFTVYWVNNHGGDVMYVAKP
jgi:hypothetical protein